MPKRKLDEGGSDALQHPLIASETDESDGSNSNSSIETNGSTDVPRNESKGPFNHREKRPKKSVQFQGVRVFYFPRKQGFVCVPSQGGSTLGMGESHLFSEDFSLKGYHREQKAVRRQILLEQKQQGKLAHIKINTKPKTLSATDNANLNSDSDSSESDLDVDDYFFLQPVSTRQRRLLLRSSGVKKIDTTEKEECRDIRLSRESCGCDCRVFCDPETCACSQAGIKCQVDRLSFPCGCSKDGCGNVNGRIEFNPVRVRTHFIHTLMRLELDRKKEQHASSQQQRLALRQQQQQQNANLNDSSSTTVDLQQPLDNFVSTTTLFHHGSDINDNPNDDDDCSDDIDLSEFNSNEKGSCRDCQNTEIADVLMQEAQLSNHGNNGSMDVDMCMTTNELNGGGVGYGGKDKQVAYTHISDLSNKNENMPCVMLFNDDDYNAESTTNAYTFKQEESSYSESSDCSSELSEDGQNFRHFQELSSFSAPAIGGFGVNGGNSFCISSTGEFQSASEPQQQPEQAKYIELSSTSASGYKLEPISEILNPIRYADYQSASGSSMSPRMWSPNAEHYSAAYLDAHTNQSSDGDLYKPTASSLGGQQSQSYSVYRSNGAALKDDSTTGGHDTHSNHEDKHLTNLDAVQSPISSNLISHTAPYAEMISQSKESCPTSPSSAPTLGKSTAESIYSNYSLTSLQSNGASNGIITEYGPVSTDISVSMSGGSSSSGGNLCAQLAPVGHDKVMASTDMTALDRTIPESTSTATTQNFGEIIKESIVETVSA